MMHSVDPYWHKAHDIFNLISLPIVIASNVALFLNWGLVRLYVFVAVFSVYIFLDLVWVVVLPRCVASPTTIIIHHIFTALGLLAMLIMDFDFCILGASGGFIEVNTFFLILRRNIRNRPLINLFFFTSWIVIRLFLVHDTFFNMQLRLSFV